MQYRMSYQALEFITIIMPGITFVGYGNTEGFGGILVLIGLE